MQDRSAGLQRRLGIDDGRQRLEIDGDQLGRVFREIAAVGEDDRDRFADMTHLVVGQQRLLRIEEVVLDLRGPFPRQRQLGVGDRRQAACASSAPLSTYATPGAAAARDRSTERMRACATWLRTNTACSVSGNFRSATNWPRPISRRRSSRRGIERPTYPLPCPLSLRLRHGHLPLSLSAPHGLGGRHHRLDDVLVAGAAAQHGGQRLAHLGFAG